MQAREAADADDLAQLAADPHRRGDLATLVLDGVRPLISPSVYALRAPRSTRVGAKVWFRDSGRRSNFERAYI